MSTTQYDEKFDLKVEAGARALVKDRAARGLLVQRHGNLDEARQEARLVLLTAMALEAGNSVDVGQNDEIFSS
ncbi:hypothetical protein D3C71_188680 [compost metagenome]